MTASDEVLDKILQEIGGIGPHQVVVLACLCLVTSLHAATHIAYVFTTSDSDYRCLVPECEKLIAQDPSWLTNAIPLTPLKKTSKCLVFDSTTMTGNCSSDNFNKSAVKRCDSHIFQQDEYYIGRQFDLICKDNSWTLSLVGSANTIGMFLGLIITGLISDKYGRKRLLLYGMSGCGLVGLIKSFSPSFLCFLTLELIEAIFSAGTCGCVFIIAVELVAPKQRAMVGAILNTFYSLGEVFLAIIAWRVRHWKLVIYYTYGPCTLLILLFFILPESLRWMLSKGRMKESKEALRRIAKTNKCTLTEDKLNDLQSSLDNSENSKYTNNLGEIFKSKRLCCRFLNCCFGWVTCAFLYYGLTLTSVSLYGDKYVDFIMISLIEIPAYWFCTVMVDRIGRKSSICGAYFITFCSCVCFIFNKDSSDWFYLFLYCMGKFGATGAFYAIYVITSEIFPTPLRHTVMGLCSTVGRLGSVTSPQTPLLSQIWEPFPLFLFAMMSLVAIIFSLFLPESKGVTLPDTIEKAKRIR